MPESERIVIRDNDYYGGSIFLEGLPAADAKYPDPYPLIETTITWEAYQGGAVTLQLQSVGELERLGRALLDGAEVVHKARQEFEARQA